MLHLKKLLVFFIINFLNFIRLLHLNLYINKDYFVIKYYFHYHLINHRNLICTFYFDLFYYYYQVIVFYAHSLVIYNYYYYSKFKYMHLYLLY